MASTALLFGNGLNRISPNSISWDVLLGGIEKNPLLKLESIPNTMIYENILMSRLKSDPDRKNKNIRITEENIKIEIAKKLQKQEINDIYEKLADISGIQHFMTTNYDYAFLKNKPEATKNTEKIYSLRRNHEFFVNEDKKVLWQIHGELLNAKSIMLGLDHYCGAIAKINSYIKGDYNHMNNPIASIADKVSGRSSYCNTSWIDLFFSHNIHIMGLSLDFSEIDLWWILNKRARMLYEGYLINNAIYYHSNGSESKEKIELLKSVKVKIIENPVLEVDYISHYQKVIKHISEQNSNHSKT